LRIGELKNKKHIGEGGLNTIIGKDSTIEGAIEVKGGLRVDGRIIGRVSVSESLAVGDSGCIEADLTARIAVIGGKVAGNIFAQDKIELQSKAVVEGDITTKNLIVEEGAVFHGTCNMKSSSAVTTIREESDQVNIPS
jgi:cytoskeletal protein CcmA (bactofilin family)